MNVLDLFSGIGAYPRSPGWKRFIADGGLLGRAKASLAEHGDDTFGEWRSLVARQRVLRGVDGLSVAMERRRLHQVGNSVCPYIAEAIGREIMTLR